MTDSTIPARVRPSVVLVREWEQQLSSSGCCGRVEGAFLEMGPERSRLFAERRTQMECAGELYRAIRDRYGDRVRLSVVDPRNLLTLLPMVLREGWRRRRPFRDILRSAARLSVNAVIVDGEVVARQRWPSPGELFAILDDVVDPRGPGGYGGLSGRDPMGS